MGGFFQNFRAHLLSKFVKLLSEIGKEIDFQTFLWRGSIILIPKPFKNPTKVLKKRKKKNQAQWVQWTQMIKFSVTHWQIQSNKSWKRSYRMNKLVLWQWCKNDLTYESINTIYHANKKIRSNFTRLHQ